MKAIYGNEARQGLKEGVDILANAVKVTLGPKGRTVVIDRNGSPVMTKDGVTVAKAVTLNDSLQNMGVEMVKDVASRQADQAGDGTTTATVLAQSMIELGLPHVKNGVNPMGIKKGMDAAVKQVTSFIKNVRQSVHTKEVIQQVATVSANNDEYIGELISTAIEAVGKNGVVKTAQSQNTSTYVEIVNGVEIDRGYISAHFVTDMGKMQAELEDVAILLFDRKVTNIKQILPILEQVAKLDKPMLLVCEDLEGEALSSLILNANQGIIKFAAIKAPGFNETRRAYLEDLAIITGATLISEADGMKLDKATMADLGFANKVIVGKEKTTFIKHATDKEAITERVNILQQQLSTTKEDWDKEKLRDRIAKLDGGIGIIYIGAGSEIELREKTDRIDDALAATKAAIEEGIVAGGGATLYHAYDELSSDHQDNDFSIGYRIVKESLRVPMTAILNNAGIDAKTELHNLEQYTSVNYGYNVLDEEITDLVKDGIIDPAKVTRVALENAASVASMLLTTECVLADS